MRKVIYHVDEVEKWPLTAANLTNMLENYRKNGVEYQIEVVANGEAVLGYTENAAANLKEKMEPIAAEGIVFAACNNAMNSHGIKREDLFSFVTVVPAGVVELADRQADGYAYIKP